MNRASFVFVATFAPNPMLDPVAHIRPVWNLDPAEVHAEFARFVQEVYNEAGRGAVEFSLLPIL